MRRSHLLLCATLGCSTPTDPPTPVTPPASPAPSTRDPDQIARDADRKPQQVMDFFGIVPGHTVVDLMAGSGYYSELLALRVGPSGKVYVHNSPFVLQRYAEGPISALMAKPSMANATRLDTPLDQPELPQGVDRITMVLFYHDTFWQKVDRKAMNRAIYGALAPGGFFGIVDHHAEAGSTDRDVKRLHRVDAQTVEREIIEAGFVLDARSDLLEHPEDDRSQSAFELRGKTSRFMLRFRKPLET